MHTCTCLSIGALVVVGGGGDFGKSGGKGYSSNFRNFFDFLSIKETISARIIDQNWILGPTMRVSGFRILGFCCSYSENIYSSLASCLVLGIQQTNLVYDRNIHRACGNCENYFFGVKIFGIMIFFSGYVWKTLVHYITWRLGI